MRSKLTCLQKNSFSKNVSIVRNKDKNFKNKNELVEFIQNIKIASTDVYTVDLYIKCACGKEHIFKSVNELSASNLVCNCGQMIIEYK